MFHTYRLTMGMHIQEHFQILKVNSKKPNGNPSMRGKRRLRKVNPNQLLIEQNGISWLEACLTKTGAKYSVDRNELLKQILAENGHN